MTTRMGGQLELEGGTMALVLPADASNDQSEVADLRKELEQAQQLGEAYARELATVFAAGQPHEVEAVEDHADVAVRRFELLVGFALAVHRPLVTVFHGLEEQAEHMDQSAATASIAGHISAGYAVVAELGRIAACPPSELDERVDVARALREAVSESQARAARHDVALSLEAPSEGLCASRPRALALLFRSLIDHAIAATPRGGSVSIALVPDGPGFTLEVRDGGPAVPVGARADLLEHRVDPSALGRPPGLALLVAHTVSGYLGSAIRLGESRQGAAVVQARLRQI
jgi:two-component system sensor histidine kinase QseC